MPRTLTFDISYRYPENAKGIAIPVILTSLYGTYRAAAKADTGGDKHKTQNSMARESARSRCR
jgi:hypothetical protein